MRVIARLSYRRALLCAVASTLLPASVWAGAWTRAPGSAYAKLAYGGATAADQFAFDGQRKPYADNVDGPAFFDRSVYAYAELGLVDGVTGVFGLAFKRVFVTDEAFRYEREGLGDFRLGVALDVERWVGDRLPGVLALNVWAEGPTGYVRNTIPAPGQGNLDVAASLDWGLSLGQNGYVQMAAGYRHRSSWYGLSTTLACQPGVNQGCIAPAEPTLGDEFLGRLEVGGKWLPGVWGNAIGELGMSVDAPRIGFSVAQPVPTHRRMLKLGVGIAIRPWRSLGLEGQIFTTPWGQNTIVSIDAFVGIGGEFDLWAAK